MAVGPIETMVPRLAGQGVSGKWRYCGVAVGPIETMVPGFPGQGVSGKWLYCGVAVGPIETMAPGLAGFQGWWSCCLFPGGFVHEGPTRSTL